MKHRWLTAAVTFAAGLACTAPALAAVPAATTVPAAATAPATAALQGPALQVTGASLIAAGTNQPLWGYRQNTERAIASTTKLMTALIVLRHVSHLSTVFAQGPWEDQPGDSQIGLVPGERMSARNLVRAMLIPSADDAAEDLAYNVGGHSVTRFLAMMNTEARRLGLTFTHYTTPTGLDTPGNYSTPYELAWLGDYDMLHFPFFRRTVAISRTTIRSSDGTPYDLIGTDTLLGRVPWIDGIKTGHTDDAGYVLVSQGTQHGMTLIGSVLGTSSEDARNANALRLLEWGFAHFRKVTPVRAGEVFARPTMVAVTGGSGQPPASTVGQVPLSTFSQPATTGPGTAAATLVAAAGYSRVVPKDAHVRVRVTAPAQLPASTAAGADVGSVAVLVDGKQVTRIPLVLLTGSSGSES